jgi:hypothetical protein
MPTEVVEQLLLASARTPAEMEHALTGAVTLAKGLFCVVTLEPVDELRPGSSIPAISLPSKVIGREIESGRATSGANGLEGVVAFAVDLGVTAAVGWVTATVVVVTLGAETDAAPAPEGTMPTNSVAASNTPPPIAPSDLRLIRLKACSLCLGTRTAYLFLIREGTVQNPRPTLHLPICLPAKPADAHLSERHQARKLFL